MEQGIVRPMAPEERRELGAVMRACFGWVPRLFFDFGKAAFVYELDGKIVGGITLSRFRIDDKRLGGLVKWIFTLPEARGKGAAGAMLDRALAWFDEVGCTETFACVEGYNTGSSNLFASRGFRIMPFSEQLRRYAIRLPMLAFRTFHMFDVGHFLWFRTAGEESRAEAEPAPNEASGFAVTALLHVLFGYIMFARLRTALTPELFWQIPVAVCAILGIRLVVMLAMARLVRLRVRYRPWETGLLLAGLIPAVFGGIFIAPGGLYPREHVWRYRDVLGRLGPIMCAGAAVMLVAGWAAFLLTGAELGPVAAQLSAIAFYYLRAFLVFEIILPVFPFVGFAGRKVLDWRPILWVVLAAASVALWVASFIIAA